MRKTSVEQTIVDGVEGEVRPVGSLKGPLITGSHLRLSKPMNQDVETVVKVEKVKWTGTGCHNKTRVNDDEEVLVLEFVVESLILDTRRIKRRVQKVGVPNFKSLGRFKRMVLIGKSRV